MWRTKLQLQITEGTMADCCAFAGVTCLARTHAVGSSTLVATITLCMFGRQRNKTTKRHPEVSNLFDWRGACCLLLSFFVRNTKMVSMLTPTKGFTLLGLTKLFAWFNKIIKVNPTSNFSVQKRADVNYLIQYIDYPFILKF